MYTQAKIRSIEAPQGKLSIIVDFNGVDEKQQSFVYETTTLSVLESRAKVDAARLNGQLAYDKTIVPGLILDITPPAPPEPPDPPDPPTQDQLDRATFIAARIHRVQMQQAVKEEYKKADDADVLAAIAAAKTAFKPGYEVLLPALGV